MDDCRCWQLILLIKLTTMQKGQELSTPNIMLKKQLPNQNKNQQQKNKMLSKSVILHSLNKHGTQITLKQPSKNNQSLIMKPHNLLQQKSSDNSTISLKKTKHKASSSQTKLPITKSLHFGREEQLALYLSPELLKFSTKHNLRQKKPQIQYVNTLKKLKKTAKAVGCDVRAKSEGIQLQLSKDLQLKVEDGFRFTFQKQFDRFVRKRLVKQSNNCCQQAANFNSTLAQDKKEMDDCLRVNEKDRQYRSYDVRRFQSYLKGKATKQRKYAYYIKKQLQQKLKKADQEYNIVQQQKSETSEQMWDTKRNTFYSNSARNTMLMRKISEFQDTQSMQSSPKHTTITRMSEYKEDLIEFLQICQFYKKIQHQLLRYLPNNHISNKINTVISQVQFGDVIKKIYEKCDIDITQLTPNRIVAILKKYPGILSTMNYIVNIIKLNISAERRKRFVDIQKTIGKFEGIIKERKEFVCEKLKQIDNPQLKKNIKESLLKTKVQCAGMNPSYTQFVKQGQQQQFSQINTFKNRTTICQILKFQSLMR